MWFNWRRLCKGSALALLTVAFIGGVIGGVSSQQFGDYFVRRIYFSSTTGVQHFAGSADPSASSGVAAPIGSLYQRSGTAGLWLKTGSGDTAWTLYTSGTVAPSSAKYITQTADPTLSAEQALSALSTGLMKVTTATGVVSSVAAPSGAVVGDTDTQTLTNKTIQCHAITATLQACGATITITDAQLKALPSTPISIVSAPGANKRLVVIKGLWRANTSAGAYTNINVTLSKLRLVYGNNVTVASEEVAADNGTDLATLLGTAAVQEVLLHNWTETVQAVADTDNQAIQVSIDNNGSGNYTGGNSANTLAIAFGYYIIG